MPEFPSAPISPAELIEEYLPVAFAEVGAPAGSDDLDVRLGVRLEGDGGGEWIVRMSGGEVTVTAGSRADASFTYVQSVEDWRGALWEGRGGAMGQGASLLFRPGEATAAAEGAGATLGAMPSPAALEQMRSLDGLVRMAVGDWSVSFKLGPGDIPAEATTTVTIGDEDAVAMASGELNPMEAFMAGRIQVTGDMTLMMQMLAVQMQAAQSGSSGGSTG